MSWPFSADCRRLPLSSPLSSSLPVASVEHFSVTSSFLPDNLVFLRYAPPTPHILICHPQDGPVSLPEVRGEPSSQRGVSCSGRRYGVCKGPYSAGVRLI